MNTEQDTLPPQALAFTQHAAEKVKELGARQDNSGSIRTTWLSRPRVSNSW
jgi:hypothetical protein